MAYRFFKVLLGFPLILGTLVSCQSIENIPLFEEEIPVKLPSITPSPSSLTDPSFLEAIEQVIYREINQYRLSQNLSPLKLNPQISQQARIHSERMAVGLIPVGHDRLDERLEIINLSTPHRQGVENLAVHINQTDPVAQVLQTWLNTPENRQNIAGNFDATGVGVAQNSTGQYYITQIFIQEKPSLVTQNPELNFNKSPLPWENRDILLERASKASPLDEQPLIALEQKIYQRVNEYRRSKKLPPLKMNAHMSHVARLHSQDMASKAATFSHDGFEGRAKAVAITIPYKSMAENLAYLKGYRDLVTTAVQGWINSDGHRKAMEGNFNLTGVGIAKNAAGEYYFTQLFVLEP